jgi:dephospho-CoA kinase
MYIIGITGGTGSGKTSAVRALQSLGALALDCDEIYHELLLNNTDMIAGIAARFKSAMTDGAIDRGKLSELVWGDPVSLCELNMITHGFVGSEIERRINDFKAQGGKVTAIDAIALIESGQNDRCDVVVGITAPQEKRISRIIKRDKLTSTQAKNRINAQQPESFYIEKCDYILENIYEAKAEFEKKCTEFFGDLIRRKTNE